MPTVLLREAVPVTPRTRLLRLGLDQGAFVFRAGQAVMVGLPDSDTRSPYSIASPPALAARGTLELLVAADGAFGDPDLDPVSIVGQRLAIEGPIGTFGVPGEAAAAPLLLVAGGTGIAPLRSVALDRLERVDAPPMTVVYSARRYDEFAFGDEFAELDRQGRLRAHMTITREERPSDWTGRSGRIDDALLAAALPGGDAWCLVCGPAGFVGAVSASLRALGVPDERIVLER